ncbi:26S proteasome complex subunit SEM1 [Galendromus occidentalis]|uniref:26S proteasome complex subunit SEM1 n=1 Tax=Galendromus occidentalis TaxID=34638 RepID=A0AAJ6QPI8_9ACAR|nr:26S proteasome complex subunit SEM1 [Galendromus occidentalis]
MSSVTASQETPKKVDLGLLEEDDEFEEFPAEEWTGKCDAEEANVWEDNWDDDNVEDDFSDQLRRELNKAGFQPQQTQDVKM